MYEKGCFRTRSKKPCSMPKQTTDIQNLIDPDAVERPLFVLRQAYLPSIVEAHQHACAQLVHADTGVLEVVTEAGRWVVPPQRGVWIPPNQMHQVISKKNFDLCTLYVDAELAAMQSKHCQVVQISPLLSQLLTKAAEFGVDWARASSQERLLLVALDQIAFLRTEPLHLPNPKDKRIARICEFLQADPSNTTELQTWATKVGASERTLARIFKEDTGLGFAQWRRQCRLLHAVGLLAKNVQVTQVAMEVGYSDMSSFVRDFKSSLGSTPGQYFGTVV
jgi:AraC-like DNA-binding protein